MTSQRGWEHIMTPDIAWPRNDYSRVPFWLHHDAAIYELEMERIFRGPAWSYLCLEAEIPDAGDFRTTWVGDTPVIVSRDKKGAIQAFVNPSGRRAPRRRPPAAPRARRPAERVPRPARRRPRGAEGGGEGGGPPPPQHEPRLRCDRYAGRRESGVRRDRGAARPHAIA